MYFSVIKIAKKANGGKVAEIWRKYGGNMAGTDEKRAVILQRNLKSTFE